MVESKQEAIRTVILPLTKYVSVLWFGKTFDIVLKYLVTTMARSISMGKDIYAMG